MKKIKREAYADMYGPTTGDKVRLADTELIVEVEKDLTTDGDEVKFGGGKTHPHITGDNGPSSPSASTDDIL